MNKLTKIIFPILCGQLWVFLCFAFIAATLDFTQWGDALRLACVAFGIPAAILAVGIAAGIYD